MKKKQESLEQLFYRLRWSRSHRTFWAIYSGVFGLIFWACAVLWLFIGIRWLIEKF